MQFEHELISLIDFLNAHDIEYAVCGGIAVVMYGYPRFTRDIDLLILSHDLEHVLKKIRPLGYSIPGGHIPFNPKTEQEVNVYRISKADGEELLSLDLVLVNDLLQDIWDNRVGFEWQGRLISVVSLAGLAKMKQLAGRTQDRLDLEKLGLLDESHED